MTLKECSKKNCGNTLTTSRGTYTFYNNFIVKSEAAKLCKRHGGVIAPLNIKEEFDAVHKFAYQCQPWCSYHFYHVGLDLVRNETRYYSDCTEWDWEKHDKLYDSRIGKGPCWDAVYVPSDKIQKIYADEYCSNFAYRTICFNAAAEKSTNSDSLVRTDRSGSLVSSRVFGSYFAFALLAFGLLMALLRSTRKNRLYEREISELQAQNKV